MVPIHLLFAYVVCLGARVRVGVFVPMETVFPFAFIMDCTNLFSDVVVALWPVIGVESNRWRSSAPALQWGP